MAKPIYVPQDEAARIIDALRTQILNSKCYGGIDIKQNFKSDDRRATLCFTPTAWIKMTALVSAFSTEVQWHGLVQRKSANVFEIYDIIVPPHTVTSATVTSDQEKYTNWINELDDETFNDLRFHGHSHVNMAVTPSVTDTDYRKDVVTQLPKPDADTDVFYIFLIINKSHAWSAEIYDLTNNALYSTVSNEIDMVVMIDGGGTVGDFVSEAKKIAVAPASPACGGKGSASGYTHTASSVDKRDYGFDRYYGGKSRGTVARTASDDSYYGVDESPTDPFYVREDWGWR